MASETKTIDIQNFVSELQKSVFEQSLIKLTLSNSNTEDLTQIIGQLVHIQQKWKLKLTHRYATKDEVKNIGIHEIGDFINQNCPSIFRQIHLVAKESESTLLFSKKLKSTLIHKHTQTRQKVVASHNREKNHLIPLDTPFLKLLGITDTQSRLVPSMADKYKQINKYVEIVADHLKFVALSPQSKIVDMGSGKGYLTFALYAYLKNQNMDAQVVGVELRPELVKLCNQIAVTCGYDGLCFESKKIEDFDAQTIDVLIALHACDTATDDAIAAGLKADCQLIICAPCCHKQVRQSIGKKEFENPIMRYGIFTERSCEMLTDTIRALILESKGYKTKVFEFVSNEHTRKNIMLTAIKTGNQKEVSQDLIQLKNQFGLEKHYLEGLI